MKFCVKCGTMLGPASDGVFVCPSCGNIQKESSRANSKEDKLKSTAETDTAPKEAKTTEDKVAAETAPESGKSATGADTNAELEAMKAKIRALEAEKELAETKAKLLEAEKKLNSGKFGGGVFSSTLNSFKNSAAVVKASAVVNKVGLKWIILIFLVLIAFITLMSCFCGLRGIYVNTDNPNEFYSFNSSHGFEYYYVDAGEPAVVRGRWSKTGDELKLKVEDELFGEIEIEYGLKDFSWSRFTLTESFLGIGSETNFERVSVIQYKDNVGRVRVTFDANGGVGGGTERVDIGSLCSEPDDEPTRDGYLFQGWYTTADGWRTGEGEEFSATDRVWERTTYYANWENLDEHVVTLNANGGDVATSSVYVEENYSYILPVPTRTGYTFLGWYTSYNGEEIRLTDEAGNSTRSWYIEQDTTAYAVWEQYIFNVTINTNDGELPNGETNAQIEIDTSYTLPIPVREHYRFTGWYANYDGEEIRLTNETGNSTRSWYIEQDITAYATWEATVYTVTYELNGGTNDADNPSGYTILTLGSDGAITLSAPTKTVVGDILSYVSNSDGTFDVTREAYTFEGWYSNPEFTGNAVTEITIDTGNVTLYAKWSESAATTTEQLYTRSGSTIYFGEYPQTRVTDSTITTALNDMRGTLPTSSNSYDWTSYGYYISGDVTNFMWYIDLEYSGGKYRGVYFTSYRPYNTIYSSSSSISSQDDNGYSTGTVYWFKYEPIKWRILTESDGNAMILSELMLDSQQYDYDGSYSNNYANSTIRRWLNDTFYNTAFGELQQAIIETTEVDNSVYSTGYSPNPNSCENTFDKVFLLSYREAVNSSYGMTDTTRQKQGSDYCKAQGSWTSTTSGYVGNGRWWLRSPHSDTGNHARSVYSDGILGYSTIVYITYYGVVPALVISL